MSETSDKQTSGGPAKPNSFSMWHHPRRFLRSLAFEISCEEDLEWPTMEERRLAADAELKDASPIASEFALEAAKEKCAEMTQTAEAWERRRDTLATVVGASATVIAGVMLQHPGKVASLSAPSVLCFVLCLVILTMSRRAILVHSPSSVGEFGFWKRRDGLDEKDEAHAAAKELAAIRRFEAIGRERVANSLKVKANILAAHVEAASWAYVVGLALLFVALLVGVFFPSPPRDKPLEPNVTRPAEPGPRPPSEPVPSHDAADPRN